MAFPYPVAIWREAPRSVKAALAVAEDFDAPRLIAVGDVVYESLASAGAEVWAAIVDGTTRRGAARFERRGARVRNPPGRITAEAWSAVAEVVARGGTVVVDGEEDLLAIPAILEAPIDSTVLYGLYLGALIAMPVRAYRWVAEALLRFFHPC